MVNNNKIFFILSLLFFILTSCATIKNAAINENTKYKNIGCLKFLIPAYASESEKEARQFRYDFMLVEKNTRYTDSEFIIAIRHKNNFFNETMESFMQEDLANLQKQVKIFYEEKWKPEFFIEKKIKFQALQFNYFYGKQKIYQRTIYLECGNTFYIISLSSKLKNIISDLKFDEFWGSIAIE